MVKQHNAKLTELEKAARAGLQDGAKKVLKRARELVPVDDGDLRKSGKVSVDDVYVVVKFTGPHAWLQHERLDYQHPSGGQAKYLEQAVAELGIGAMVEGVAARVRRG